MNVPAERPGLDLLLEPGDNVDGVAVEYLQEAAWPGLPGHDH